jgi:hypothetical protein
MQEIIEASLIDYIKNIKLCKTAFTFNNTNGLVLSINSGFFINYTKLLKALA